LAEPQDTGRGRDIAESRDACFALGRCDAALSFFMATLSGAAQDYASGFANLDQTSKIISLHRSGRCVS